MTGLIFNFRISRCLSKNSIRNLSSVSWLAESTSEKKPLSDIQKMNLLEKNNLLQMVANSYTDSLFNELLKECQIKKGVFFLRKAQSAKELIITSDIKTLKELKFLPKDVNVIKNLLANLEPFPFVPPNPKPGINSIKNLRDAIEKQYLAWKLNVDISVINRLYFCYKKCLTVGRSLQSCQRNINVINAIPKLRTESVANKIYLLNMKPFCKSSLVTFNNNLLGVNWDNVGLRYPNIIEKSYNSIMLIVNALKKQGFSNRQIKYALPHIKCELKDLLERFNYILSHPTCSAFRNHPQFLILLRFNSAQLQNLGDQNFKRFSDISKFLIKIDRKNGRTSLRGFLGYLKKVLEIEDSALEDFNRHLSKRKVLPATAYNNLQYLKQRKFSSSEILESLLVILYPKKSIQHHLRNVIKNNESLKELGFKNGCVDEETHLFSRGTKLKNKSLQLCLYYLQKFEDLPSHEINISSIVHQ